MPDVKYGDKPKRLVRLAAWYLRHKYAKGKGVDQIHDDMVSCGNPSIALINQAIQGAGDQIKEVYQRSIVKDFSELGLWVIYKDTAYRDVFFYVLNELLKDPDKLRELIAPYVKSSDQWYVNGWYDSKQHTKELQVEKKIPAIEGEMAYDETIWTPGKQQQRFKKIFKEIEQEQRKRSW